MTSSLPTVQRVIQNALEVSQLKYSQHPRPGGAP
ncbi:YbjN domain-containing protein, partial [Mycobacterium tuberculosis]